VFHFYLSLDPTDGLFGEALLNGRPVPKLQSIPFNVKISLIVAVKSKVVGCSVIPKDGLRRLGSELESSGDTFTEGILSKGTALIDAGSDADIVEPVANGAAVEFDSVETRVVNENPVVALRLELEPSDICVNRAIFPGEPVPPFGQLGRCKDHIINVPTGLVNRLTTPLAITLSSITWAIVSSPFRTTIGLGFGSKRQGYLL